MKRKNIISLSKKAQEKNLEQVPVFVITDKDDQRANALAPQTDKISFLDIKELYDRAYTAQDLSEKEGGRDDYKAKEMMSEAIKMDMAYRCQLSRQSAYKKQSKINDFKVISKAV